ncbi:type II secretion system F family protein [Microbacterium sp. KR10-403]|uniref:type II secretion system F family protein n=1 Tax=Microbacterium sp. KR10-403 TaxID=3158581 RepID=UPI0032E45717
MTVLLGAMLATGILLVLAPWLWPLGRSRPDRAPGALGRLMDAAGYAHVSVRVPVAVCVLASAAAAAVVWLLLGVPIVAVLAGVAGAAAPFLWLRARRMRLLRSRRGLWPDVCDLLIASVRAGMSLPDAVASLEASAPGALRPAFAAFARDIAASGHFDSAAVRLKTTLSDPVADRIIETLRMARQVGGTELVPVLRALGASVRADATLRAEVEARQSWLRSAAVLGVVAPWVVLALLAARPEGAAAYSSPQGIALVVAGAAISFVAYRLMIRLGRLPDPRRWFG